MEPIALAIPLRDGLTLDANLWKAGPGPQPVILRRGAGTRWALSDLNQWHAAGYHCVSNDTRKYAGARFAEDLEDGYDCIEWMAKQDWCNGQVVMYGKSKWGATQWRAARAQPPHLVAIVPQVIGIGLGATTGAQRLAHRVYGQTQIPDPGWDYYLKTQLIAEDEPDPDKTTTLENNTPNPEPEDSAQKPSNKEKELFGKIQVPTFVYGGFYDAYADQMIQSYLGCKKYGLWRL